MDRRSFLLGSTGMALSALGFAGCSRPPTRAGVLAGLVERITVPDGALIVRDSQALEEAVRALGRAPAAGAIDDAREALRAAIRAWQRAYAFRMGPFVDSHALLRATFWPVRSSAIQGYLRGTRKIDAALIGEIGVDVKGLFALEHLLFEGPAPGATWLTDAQLPRVLTMMRALAADVRGHAERAAKELGDGEAFAKKLAEGGQESLSKLVNELLATVETASFSRLDRVLSMQRDGTLKVSEVQGAPSGLSAEIPRIWLEVASAIYDHDGHGLGELVRLSAAGIEPRVQQAFESSTAALDAIDAPLEQLVKKDPARLERATRALKDLEVVIKADLASALGVTLTFTSSDGD